MFSVRHISRHIRNIGHYRSQRIQHPIKITYFTIVPRKTDPTVSATAPWRLQRSRLAYDNLCQLYLIKSYSVVHFGRHGFPYLHCFDWSIIFTSTRPVQRLASFRAEVFLQRCELQTLHVGTRTYAHGMKLAGQGPAYTYKWHKAGGPQLRVKSQQ